MPTFHVTAPDGHVLEITGPEGSTQEQAIEQAKKQYQPKAAENKVEAPSFLDQAIDFGSKTLGTAASDLTAPFNPSTYTNLASNVQDPKTAFAPLAPKAPERQPSSVIDKLRFAMAGGQPENAPVMRAPQMETSEGLGHVLAAGIGGKTVEKAPAIARGAQAVGTGLKVAAPDLIGGGSMIVGGELLSHLPGMEWPARIALDYPGARQIARGMHAGYGATRETLKNPGKVAPITEDVIPGGQDLEAAQRIKKQQLKFVPGGGADKPVAKPKIVGGKFNPEVTPPAASRDFLGGRGRFSREEEGSLNTEKMNQIYENMIRSAGAVSKGEPGVQYSDFPSARKVPGSISQMPVAVPETPQVQAVARPGTQGPAEPETPPNAPERQQTAPETAPEKPTSSKVIDISQGQDKVIVKNLRDKLNQLKQDPKVDPSNLEDIEGYMGELEDIVKRGPDYYNKLYDHPKGYEAAIENSSGEMEKAIRRTSRTLKGEITSEQSQREAFNDVANKPKSEKTTTDDPNQQWSWNDIKEKYGQARVDTTKAKLTDLADRLKSSNMKLEEFLQLPQEMQDQIVQVPRHPKNPNRPKYSSGFHRGYTNLLREIHGGE